MAISFALKPRRTDFRYMAFLYFQYGLFAIGSNVLFMAGHNWDGDKVTEASIRCLIYTVPIVFALGCRLVAAKNSDQHLSDILTESVIRDGLVVGLGQLAFLVFAAIQCESDARLKGTTGRYVLGHYGARLVSVASWHYSRSSK